MRAGKSTGPQAAPIRDEERDDLGERAQACDLHPLVEAVVILRPRAVAERRDAEIAAIETGVVEAGERGLFEPAPEHRLVRRAERRHRVLAVVEHVAIGQEAVPHEFGRRVGEERVVRRRAPHRRLDLRLRRGDVLARQDGDAAIEVAPGGHARRPVPAGDPAQIEVDGTIDLREMRLRPRASVPFRRQRIERIDERIGAADCVRSGARVGDMHGLAAHADAEPQHADLRAREAEIGRFRHEHRVGAVAALQRRKRAVAGAFLLDHRLQEEIGRRPVSRALQRLDREDRGDRARFHVARAAPVHPAVAHDGFERRRVPHLVRAFRHHVAMPLQDKRTPLRFRAAQRADDAVGILVGDIDRREARHVP